jgi:hypothetical protein
VDASKAVSLEKPKVEKIRISQTSAAGTLWFVGWLFTIGFLHLTFWSGLLAIVLWPYDLGVYFSAQKGP